MSVNRKTFFLVAARPDHLFDHDSGFHKKHTNAITTTPTAVVVEAFVFVVAVVAAVAPVVAEAFVAAVVAEAFPLLLKQLPLLVAAVVAEAFVAAIAPLLLLVAAIAPVVAAIAPVPVVAAVLSPLQNYQLVGTSQQPLRASSFRLRKSPAQPSPRTHAPQHPCRSARPYSWCCAPEDAQERCRKMRLRIVVHQQ